MLKYVKALWVMREGVVFQLGVWALAITLALTLLSVLRETSRADALKADLAVPSIDLRSVPFKREDYLAVRERVGRSYADSSVKFNASDDSLTIKASKVEDYAQWRMAVSDVMLSMPGAVWSVKSLCAGEKCTDGAFNATITALVRSFAVGRSSAVVGGAPAAAGDAAAPATGH